MLPRIPKERTEDHWPHRCAWLTAGATLPLLFLGGLVTSKGAGLAVPDWPTTFGYNMFLYPWSKMIGDIFFEHSHRLVASVVGVLTLALALVLFFRERRRWLRWLGVIAFGLVLAQGVIGGLRVVLLEGTLAILHACLAQAFFALIVSLVLFTSREWREKPRKVKLSDAGPLRRLSLLATGVIYLQGIFGAVLRYTGAGLEIHALLAVLVTLQVLLLALRIARFHAAEPLLWRPVMALGALLVLQLALGLGSYAARFTPLGQALPLIATELLRTAHVVTGALMGVISLVLTLRSYRFQSSLGLRLVQGFLSERASA